MMEGGENERTVRQVQGPNSTELGFLVLQLDCGQKSDQSFLAEIPSENACGLVLRCAELGWQAVDSGSLEKRSIDSRAFVNQWCLVFEGLLISMPQ